MSTTTTNYGLVKPELTDVADITAMNPNWDIIDEELSNIGETVEEALDNLTPEAIGASPSNHTHTAEQVGALPLTGGTLSNHLRIETQTGGQFTSVGTSDGARAMFSKEGNMTLISADTGSVQNARQLRVYNPNSSYAFDKTLMFVNKENGTEKEYKIFGEHNITKGTTDIGAGSALATGCIHLVYE